MRTYLFVLIFVVSPGCTSVALKRATVSHANSSTDLRYQEVIENLAMSAANPDILPAYSSIYAGTTDINDNVRATSASVWARTALQHPLRFTQFFSTQTADFLGSRAVKSNWTLDPTVVPEKLRAMQAACRWVAHGFEHGGPDVKYLMAYKPAGYEDPGQAAPRLKDFATYKLRLYSEQRAVSPREGTSPDEVTVAILNGQLYLRFIHNGYIIAEKYESQLNPQARRLAEELNGLLNSKNQDGDKMWDRWQSLTQDERVCVVTAVASVLGLVPPYARQLTPGGWPDESGYYFNVADQLAKLPPGWLHCESRWRDVPRNACYRAACGDKFVWVGPEGMEAFSNFVLIMQKIARTNLSSAYFPQTRTRKIQKNFTFVEGGKTYYANATVYLDEKGILTTGENTSAIPVKQRIDNVGQNSDLKSIINAAAKSSTP